MSKILKLHLLFVISVIFDIGFLFNVMEVFSSVFIKKKYDGIIE